MAESIDSLQIEINAKASKANDAIDRLVAKLDRLATSLSRINGTNLNGLANGVQRLGTAMQTMNNVSTADFTRLATNLTRLGSVNTSALNSAASSMSHLTRAFSGLGAVSTNAQSISQLVNSISRLGGANVQRAIANIPQLATAMNSLMSTLSRAPRVNQNIIQMTNALANLASQGSRVGTASNSIVTGFNRTDTATRKSSKGFKGLTSAIGKFYATYFMVIRGLKGLWSSIKSTADYIEAYNYFNVALGKIGSDWSHQFEQYGYKNAESYAESFNTRLSERLGKLSGLKMEIGADGKGILSESGLKNLGLNIQEITQYASQLASVTNSVGQTGETSLAASSAFTKLAGDISSLFNVDYSSVAKNLQSGLIGQSRALYKYGIDITNATLQTKAYELGLSKSVSEMTQAEKMQLRMLVILEDSKVAWGDLANTINSPSNMIRQLTNNLKETGLVLGQLFIPLLEKVLPVINGVTIAIKRLLVNIAGLLGVKIDLDKFGQGYTETEDTLDDLTGSYEDAAEAAEEYKNQLLGFDEVTKLSDSGATASIGVSDDTIDLTEEILKLTGAYEEAWAEAYKKMENEAQKIADKVYDIFVNGKWYEAGSSIGSLISSGLTDDGDDNKSKWENAGKWITDTICGALDFVNGFIESIDEVQLGNDIVDLISNINVGKITVNVLDVVISLAGATVKLYFGIWDGIYQQYGLEGLILAIIGSNTPSGVLGVKLFIEFWAEIKNAKFVEDIQNWWNDTALPAIQEVMAVPVGIAYDYVIEPVISIGQEVVEKAWEHAQKYWDAIKPTFDVFIDISKQAVEGAKSILKSLWGSPPVQIALDLAENALSVVWDKIQKNWDKLKAKVKIGLELVENAVPLLWDATLTMWDGLNTFLTTGISIVSNGIADLWEDVKEGWKQKAELLNIGLSVSQKGLEELWGNITFGWGLMRNTLSISLDWVKNAIQNLWTRGQNTFNSIKNNLLVSIDWISDTIKRLWENLKTAWNNITKGGLSISITSILGIGTSGGGFGARFATGGFPEDGLFFANHNELVGQFSNGKTAVANNAQITEGIKWASYEGMRMAMAEFKGGNTNVNVTLQGDADGLFKVVQNKANNFTTQTGRPAFLI